MLCLAYLELTKSEAMSAYLNCRYWNQDSFLPNCLRLFMQRFAAQRQKVAPPKLQLAMLILPPSKALIAILKPSPSLPIRLAAGMRTLSNVTRAVGWIVQPIFSSFFPYNTPFWFPSTMKADTCSGEVFAMTMQKLLKLPPEINIFEPDSTYSLPSLRANDFMALESEPESGSVRQQLEKSSIDMRRGRYLSFCYWLPNSSTIQQHMLWMERQAEVGTQPVASASKMMEAYSLLRPVPLLQQIAEKPIQAASRNASTGKYSFFSHSMAQGLSFFLAKSRAWVRRARRSSPRELSSNLQMPSQTWDQSCSAARGVQSRAEVLRDKVETIVQIIYLLTDCTTYYQERESHRKREDKNRGQCLEWWVGRVIIIKLMSRQSREGSITEPTLATIEVSPERQEWAVINKFKALQFERMKARQRSIDRQKKQSYRKQLDNQLNSRNDSQALERQQDRIYSQHLAELAEAQRQREQASKQDRFQQRKNVDQLNHTKIDEGRSRVLKDGDSGYHLEIGEKSQKEHRDKSSMFRKEMMDTLDLQLRQKDEEARMSRQRNQEVEELHKKIQENYFKPQDRKVFSQNQKIYEYYNDLEQQRQVKEQQIDVKFVEEAQQRRLQAEAERERQEKEKKQANKVYVKQTLGQQIREHKRRLVEESTINPEDISYGFFSSVFEPKYKGYNKEEYKRELLAQAEQQKMRKVKENHMNEEEYKLNMNQLSKAVIGQYAQSNYLDRSLGAIGDHKKFQLDATPEVKDKDADIIKKRIATLRNRGALSYLQ